MTRIFVYLMTALLMSGCLSRKPLNKETFAFKVPESTRVSAPANAASLTLNQITVAAPFDSQSLTYRTGEFSYERDPYAGFLVSPAESMMGPIRALLDNSEKFSTVGDKESSVRGNLNVEIAVTQMYGDFRDKTKPSSVLEMHFTVTKPRERFGGQNRNNTVLFEKTRARRIPLKARTAAAVVEGLNMALDQIVTEFANDVPQK